VSALEETRGEDTLVRVRADWEDLFARCPDAAVFLSPQWQLAWWRHLGGGWPWFLGLRDGGRLVALAPLFVYLGEGGRRVGFVGSGVSDRLDVLAEPGRAPEAASAVLEHLWRGRDAWDVCELGDLPAASPLLEAAARLGAEIEDDVPRLVRDLPPDVEAFRTWLGPHGRRNLRRARTLLAPLGPLAFERVRGEEVAPRMEDLFELHGARWRDRGESGVFASPRIRAFHREAATELEAAGWLRLRVLKAGGRVAAVVYGFARGDRASAYAGGFDPALAKASPGTLLNEWCIEESIAEGASTYDFLRGDEGYKLGFGATPRPQRRLRLVARPGSVASSPRGPNARAGAG
jgi:CelD/BcsL family acetyltransferase involved in cellulose biosynthesis